MRLELTISGLTLVFYPSQDPPPAGSAISFPWLASISNINEMARASLATGVGAGESSSVAVALDNTGNQVGELLGVPLRLPASIYDGAALLFEGVIARVNAGLEFGLTIES